MPDSPLTADARIRAAELFTRHAEPVAARLRRRYHGVDPDRVADAVVEAILAVPPGEPDESRYLFAHARQRLRVFLRGDTRRRRREEKYADGVVTSGRIIGPSPDSLAITRELAAAARARIALTAEDVRILDLWLAGVTDPSELAARLGLPVGDGGRHQAVTMLARLRKRLERERQRQATDPEDHP